MSQMTQVRPQHPRPPQIPSRSRPRRSKPRCACLVRDESSLTCHTCCVTAEASCSLGSAASKQTRPSTLQDPDEDEPADKRQKLSASAESDAAYKGELKDILKSKTDHFEQMVSGEEDVRLGEDGWKARYYEQKFGLSEPEDQATLVADLRRCYVEGLCWVMRYYFDGVASWRWFYPYHYAPFASDLTNISQLKVRACAGSFILLVWW